MVGRSIGNGTDRVGTDRARSVRVFAPADETRRSVIRWASRHAHRTGARLQVLVDPEGRCVGHAPPDGVLGLLGQTVRDLASRVLVPLRGPATSLVRDLEGAVAGARLLVVPQSLAELPALVDTLSEPIAAVPDLPLPPADARVVLALAPWSGPEVVGTAFETAARYGVELRAVQVVERVGNGDEAVRACEDELAAWRLARPEVRVDLEVVERDAVRCAGPARGGRPADRDGPPGPGPGAGAGRPLTRLGAAPHRGVPGARGAAARLPPSDLAPPTRLGRSSSTLLVSEPVGGTGFPGLQGAGRSRPG